MTATHTEPTIEETVGPIFLNGPLEDAESFAAHFPKLARGEEADDEVLCLSFGVSATGIAGAGDGEREAVVQTLLDHERRHLIRSAMLVGVVSLGIILILNDPVRIIALAGAMLKGGTDLGRFAARRRAIRTLRSA